MNSLVFLRFFGDQLTERGDKGGMGWTKIDQQRSLTLFNARQIRPVI